MVAIEVIDGFVRSGRNSAVVSTVTVTELLVHPLRAGRAETYRELIDLLRYFPNLHLRGVDFDVAETAARLRAEHGLRTPDALIVATGLVGAVPHLVTNDKEWRRRLQPLQEKVAVRHLASYLPFS